MDPPFGDSVNEEKAFDLNVETENGGVLNEDPALRACEYWPDGRGDLSKVLQR